MTLSYSGAQVDFFARDTPDSGERQKQREFARSELVERGEKQGVPEPPTVHISWRENDLFQSGAASDIGDDGKGHYRCTPTLVDASGREGPSLQDPATDPIEMPLELWKRVVGGEGKSSSNGGFEGEWAGGGTIESRVGHHPASSASMRSGGGGCCRSHGGRHWGQPFGIVSSHQAGWRGFAG